MRRRVASALERGRFRGVIGSSLAAVWARRSRPERDLAVPHGARVVGVAGATLGGSGATPFVLALAKRLSDHGVGVAVAAHSYRARCRTVRRVRPDDAVTLVGDEALWLGRELFGAGVEVWVGPDRSTVVATAARSASVVVIDNCLQAAPSRLSLSILVVDAARPWGAGACPPQGDLRASVNRMVDAADVIVAVGPSASTAPRLGLDRIPTLPVVSVLAGLRAPSGDRSPLSRLCGVPFGVVLGIARPERVLTALSAHGLRPADVALLGDHASPVAFQRYARISTASSIALWVTTAKCATKLGSSYRGAPVAVLDHHVEPPKVLVERAGGLCATPSRAAW